MSPSIPLVDKELVGTTGARPGAVGFMTDTTLCIGCGYCVPACPFGVPDLSPADHKAHKCTLCYDRLGDGLEPACAKSCPTESIQFGPLDELRERADRRLAQLHDLGVHE